MTQLFAVIVFLISVSTAAPAAPPASGFGVKAPGGKKLRLQKTAKSLFLIKKAKVDANVGEPQFYPIDAQLRTVINDPVLHNITFSQ